MKKYFAPLLVTILLYACTNSSESDNSNITNDIEPIEISVSEKSKECEDSISRGCAQFKATYSILKSKTDKATNTALIPLNQSIYSIFSQTFIDFIPEGNLKLTSDVDYLKTSFFKKHKKDQRMFKEGIGYEILNEVTIPYFNNKIVSVRQNQMTYAGGAHPDSELLYYTLDFTTGKSLNPYTWIEDTNEVKEQLLVALKQQMKMNTETDLEEKGFFISDKELILPANILIEQDSVSFAFNSYEIAPYSYGIFNLKLPKSAVKLKN
jgi:hypothetical protein